jgi:hypothetical protein
MEKRHQGVEVASARRREKGIDDLSLAGDIGLLLVKVRALQPTSRSAGELPRGRRSPVDHRGDLVERELEDVMEHEASLSAGASESSTTRRATPTESASSAWSSG